MKIIKIKKIKKSEVLVPGSKSYTHRILIASALSDGKCVIRNFLKSEDTSVTEKALLKMGISIEHKEDDILIYGKKGSFDQYPHSINLKNSGTSMRLLTAICALGKEEYTLSGSERMHKRPVEELLSGLRQIGVKAVSVNNNGCPPVKISGTRISGGKIMINCDISSQFLSALLLISPYTQKGVEIRSVNEPVSKPYIDITLEVMEKFGIKTYREGYTKFTVPGNQIYKAGKYSVEPDCSQAGYFWTAAAVTGSLIKVKGTSLNTQQGDVCFVKVLQNMGCKVFYETDGISVQGRSLSGISVNMEDMPDLVPTLAVAAAFAKGKTIIKNINHLQAKESNRLSAIINELAKTGIEAKHTNNDLIIIGGSPHGGIIETYNDHRIAMSFAIAGLIVPGIKIKNEKCVEKSFPNFWDVFENL